MSAYELAKVIARSLANTNVTMGYSPEIVQLHVALLVEHLVTLGLRDYANEVYTLSQDRYFEDEVVEEYVTIMEADK